MAHQGGIPCTFPTVLEDMMVTDLPGVFGARGGLLYGLCYVETTIVRSNGPSYTCQAGEFILLV